MSASLVIYSSTAPELFESCSYFAASLVTPKKKAPGLPHMCVLKSRVDGGDDMENASVVNLVGIAPDGKDVAVPFDGSTLQVRVDRVDPVVGDSYGATVLFTLTVSANSGDIIEKFIQLSRTSYESAFATKKTSIRIFTAGKYGWTRGGALPKRNPSSVVLKDDTMSHLVDDLNEFIRSESDYVRFGIPYKRVYLFHGPPGTGKTSTVFALASHFGKNIAMMTMASKVQGFDDRIIDAINNLPKNSILAIEDADALFPPTREGDGATDTPGLAALLNILDGNLRKHGMIVCLTTNYVDRLDPALVRPGRIDVMLEVPYASPDQAAGLYKLYFPKDTQGSQRLATIVASSSGLSTAYLNSLLFANRKDATSFWTALESAATSAKKKPSKRTTKS